MFYAGIDVSAKRGQAVAVLDEARAVVHTEPAAPAQGLAQRLAEEFGPSLLVAIDASRGPGAGPKWGRQCERELFRLGGRIQWTPPAEFFAQGGRPDKKWFEVGFGLFADFAAHQAQGLVLGALEVWPPGAYARLGGLTVTLPMGGIDRKARADQLDAVCCALVAWCHARGWSRELGDDTEGRLVLPAVPQPLPEPLPGPKPGLKLSPA